VHAASQDGAAEIVVSSSASTLTGPGRDLELMLGRAIIELHRGVFRQHDAHEDPQRQGAAFVIRLLLAAAK
jgi:hypothetical protein